MQLPSKIQSALKKIGFVTLISVMVGCGQKTDSNADTKADNQAAAKQERILKIGYIGPSKTVGGAVGWAINNGTLQDKISAFGFTGVQEVVFPNGPDLSEALLSNNLDIGVFGDTPALIGRANKGGSRLIGLNNVALDAWVVSTDKSIKSLSDLNGKNVGVAKGSYLHRYLNGLIDQGLVSNVEQKFILPRDARPALDRGDIAAYVAPIQLGPFLISEGLNVVDKASQHKLQGNSVIIAREDFLKELPGFFEAFDSARRAAAIDLKARPDDYYAYYVKNTAYSEQVIRDSYPIEGHVEETFPALAVELLEGTKAFLLSKELIKEDFKLDDWKYTAP
jgi:sulfonate transport system substrate-binding protein